MDDNKYEDFLQSLSVNKASDLVMAIGSLLIIFGALFALVPAGWASNLLGALIVVLGVVVNLAGFIGKLISGRRRD